MSLRSPVDETDTRAPVSRWVFLVPLLVGTIGYLVIVGPRVLDPANVAWLGEGDPLTHYLGWEFFRDSPLTMPLGRNPRYGLEIGSSIIYSDSIPLLAIR
jgi:hypothetical protein